jgi:hypothetical protein
LTRPWSRCGYRILDRIFRGPRYRRGGPLRCQAGGQACAAPRPDSHVPALRLNAWATLDSSASLANVARSPMLHPFTSRAAAERQSRHILPVREDTSHPMPCMPGVCGAPTAPNPSERWSAG